MLEIQHISKSYGNKKILTDIQFTIDKGEIVGLLGSNGAGKTTLMKCILGLCHPSKGYITEHGNRLYEKDNEDDRLLFAFSTCEGSCFTEWSAYDYISAYKSIYANFSEERFEQLMKFFDFTYSRHLFSYSLGERSQFETILALCQGTPYILLDEPFSTTDYFRRQEFYQMLLSILTEEETLILSTHLLEEIQYLVGRVLLLDQGKLIGDLDMCEFNEQERPTRLVDWISSKRGGIVKL